VASAWSEWTVAVEQVTEGADGRVAIVMTMHARGKGSGAGISERTAQIWTLRVIPHPRAAARTGPP
jgi:hypothetical protein